MLSDPFLQALDLPPVSPFTQPTPLPDLGLQTFCSNLQTPGRNPPAQSRSRIRSLPSHDEGNGNYPNQEGHRLADEVQKRITG